MANIYYEKDCDLGLLKEKTIAIIGYGSQGHAQAQNLRDSGFNVIVSEVTGSDNYKLALEHSFEPMGAEEASNKADIVHILVPDDVQKRLYHSEIEKNLTKGKALVFSHGFNILYGQITPPVDVDVYMVAPKAPGHLLRQTFEEGKGVPSLIAVEQNATGQAKELSKAHACGIGSGKAAILETTFKEETETDLFGEQSVLCGGITELIKAGFETLVNAGYQPEIAYFECCHEMKLIIDLIYHGGFSYMRYSVSDTAEYGDYTTSTRIITEETRKEMRNVLSEVQNGVFARNWILENQANRPMFNTRRRMERDHQIEKIGTELRKMMSWIKKS